MILRRRLCVTLLIGCAFIQGTALKAGEVSKLFRNWPAGDSPREIGNRVAARFLATPHTNFGNPNPPSHITYPEVATWYGALTFAESTRNKALELHLIQRFEPLFTTEANLIPQPVHVDNTVFGAVP